MASVSITTYGQYSSGNYGAHALRVDVGPLRLWFSYSTCVAFHLDGQLRRVRENSWGPTTGKHINAIDGGNKRDRLDGETFQRELDAALASVGLAEPVVRM